MKIIIKCPYCNKIAEVTSENLLKDLSLIIKTYSCGHTVTENFIVEQNLWPENRDEKWTLARHYQQEAVEFIENSNFFCLVADEMGLGKTIEILLAVRYNKKKLCPILLIMKASLRYNWAAEIMKWVNSGQNGIENQPYIIPDGKSILFPGFNFYLASMDVLNKKNIKDQIINEIKPKLVIIDESHNFKDPDAKRTSALHDIIRILRPHIVCLSGTPILNNADEFFTTLNLIKPEHWPMLRSFRWKWLEENGKGGFGGIIKYKQDDFKHLTSKYIIRRLKREVLTDLPPFSRNFKIIDVSNSEYVNAYNKTSDELKNLLESMKYERMNAAEKRANVLAYFTIMRELSGLMKVMLCVEDCIDFLENTDGKLCIGIHHRKVGDMLMMALANYNPLRLDGSDDVLSKREKERLFKLPANRLMLCSTLAGGEGLNLQFCANAIQLERQWNVMKERQFEGRFHRFGQTEPTNVDYIIAKGTLDEFMTQLEDQKKIWTDTAVEIDSSDETNISVGWMELAQAIAGRKL